MPFRPTERQYRSFAATNFRAIETDGGEPSYKVRGYFTTFDEEYCLYEGSKYWPAEYERIDPHALDDADMSDVIMQFDHEGMVMARQRNNSLTIGTDDHGAWCEADLSGCQQARDLFEAITNELVVEMSFAFTVDYDEELGNGYTTYKDEQGDYHTTITRISKVYDVSAVSLPANPGTDLQEARKRSYLYDTIKRDIELHMAEEKRIESDRSRARRARRARALQLSNI